MATTTLAPAMNKLRYDESTYTFDLRQSIGPGDYALGTPVPHCRPCLQSDARVTTGTTGGSECARVSLVDVESDLHNITRQATGCPKGKYRPTPPCALRSYPDCRGTPSEDTRLSNPPCTLRGTGWNRWEWLCTDPQERVMVPFDFNVDTAIVAKDNHRPHVARPLDQTLALPAGKHARTPAEGMPDWMIRGCDGKPLPAGDIPTVAWRGCAEAARVNHGQASMLSCPGGIPASAASGSR